MAENLRARLLEALKHFDEAHEGVLQFHDFGMDLKKFLGHPYLPPRVDKARSSLSALNDARGILVAIIAELDDG